MVLGNDADQNQFNRYELKLDKFAYCMDHMETALHSKFADIEHSLEQHVEVGN